MTKLLFWIIRVILVEHYVILSFLHLKKTMEETWTYSMLRIFKPYLERKLMFKSSLKVLQLSQLNFAQTFTPLTNGLMKRLRYSTPKQSQTLSKGPQTLIMKKTMNFTSAIIFQKLLQRQFWEFLYMESDQRHKWLSYKMNWSLQQFHW